MLSGDKLTGTMATGWVSPSTGCKADGVRRFSNVSSRGRNEGLRWTVRLVRVFQSQFIVSLPGDKMEHGDLAGERTRFSKFPGPILLCRASSVPQAKVGWPLQLQPADGRNFATATSRAESDSGGPSWGQSECQ